MKNAPLINESFRLLVESHIFGNLLIKDTLSPLILGIFGPPGEGKTFQLDYICKELKIKNTLISPGELESENAGFPSQLLRTEYIKAGSSIIQGSPPEPAVLIINDVDTVLGNWGTMVQYTVNRQTVFGQLMHFCDYPNEVGGKQVARVPIIITGNNPSILYPPLLRAGRMRLMSWEPTLQDKVQIVSRIFDSIPVRDVEQLVSQYPHQPVAFWSDVYARFWELSLHQWVNSQPRLVLVGNLQKRNEFAISGNCTIGDIKKHAAELNNSDIRQKSYLKVEPLKPLLVQIQK